MLVARLMPSMPGGRPQVSPGQRLHHAVLARAAQLTESHPIRRLESLEEGIQALP